MYQCINIEVKAVLFSWAFLRTFGITCCEMRGLLLSLLLLLLFADAVAMGLASTVSRQEGDQ